MNAASKGDIKRGVTVYKPGKCYRSCTLYNSRQLEVANLIGLEGNVVHSWSYPQGYTWHYAELLPNGHLGAIIKEEEGKVPGMLIELDWDGHLVRRFDVPVHHDFEWLENGNILVYDNGCNSGRTRILEMNPLTEEIVWEYKADPPSSFFSFARGSNQRLPNGNTSIADSDDGRLFEVTSEGEIVWEFVNPDRRKDGKRMALYRATRYAPEFVEQFTRK